MTLAVVPTLDAIAQNPQLVEQLPLATCTAMVLQAAGVLAALGARVGSMTLEVHAPEPGGDELVGPKEAGRLLNVSASTVREKIKAQQRPYVDFAVNNGTKKISLSRQRIMAYIQRRR
jgi:hypothetical protein